MQHRPTKVRSREPARPLHIHAIHLIAAALFLIALPGVPAAAQEGKAAFSVEGGGGGAAIPGTATGREGPANARAGFRWQDWWRFRAPRLVAERRRGLPPREMLPVAALPVALRALRVAIDAEDPDEEGAAAFALARTGDPSAVADLLWALERTRGDVVRAARITLALGVLGTPDVRTHLTAIMRDDLFARSALGDRNRPIAEDVRAAAILALGMLPTKAADDPIRAVILHPTDYPVALVRSACTALGLRSNDREPLDDAGISPDLERFGPPVTDAAFITPDLEDYLIFVGRADIDAAARGSLLISLARLMPANAEVRRRAVLLSGDPAPELARSAILALGAFGTGDDRAIDDALERHCVADDDTGTAGLAAIVLGARASDDGLDRLFNMLDGAAALRPFAIFGLLEAAHRDAGTVGIVVRALKSRLPGRSPLQDDVAPTCLALGILDAAEAAPILFRIAAEHPFPETRAAAGLGLGLLRDPDAFDADDTALIAEPKSGMTHSTGVLITRGAGAAANAFRRADPAEAVARRRLYAETGERSPGRAVHAAERVLRLIADRSAASGTRIAAIHALGRLSADPRTDRLETMRRRLAPPITAAALDLVALL